MSKDCGNIHSDSLLFAVCCVIGVPFKDSLNSSQQAALNPGIIISSPLFTQ